MENHGRVRVDDYYWLKEREDPKVIAYLEAENAYVDAMTAHTAGLQSELVAEFRNRIKQTDLSVPYLERGYYYYSRVEEGSQYPIYCRKKGNLDAPEEILLDVNRMTEGDGFLSVSPPKVGLNQNIAAFAVDSVGRRIYTIGFKDLETGEMLPDSIPDVTSNFTWAEDGRALFYAKQDPATLRRDRIYRHTLGSDAADDVLVYQEKDETFSTYVYKTKSRRHVIICSSQTLADECRFVDAARPEGEFRVIQPRTRGLEYRVDHRGDRFYIVTNHEAKNFRLMDAPAARPGLENWREVVPHRNNVLLEDIEVFRDYYVLAERQNGLVRFRVRKWSGGEHEVDFAEPAYDAGGRNNAEFDSTVFRYRYESLNTPETVYDYNLATRERTRLKQDEIGGGYDSENYVVERVYATARDGARVPVSLVAKKPYEHDATRPLLLYGYGSYGFSIDAGFSPYAVSLLDRGFVYAIAHIRGGQELGREWYENGRQLKKKNTFTDFIDTAEFLVKEGYADPQRLFAKGGSAGGLLMGAVLNMRPDLWRGVIAAVPFVDVVTTMLDPSIPLTSSEWDEWGDPRKPEYFDYILSYSPYDQVSAQDYPALLVTTSLHDSQVQYWEPAKWVAKLRALKTDRNPLLLKTEMEAGHGGVSGRYRRYEQIAFEDAFLIDLATSEASTTAGGLGAAGGQAVVGSRHAHHK